MEKKKNIEDLDLSLKRQLSSEIRQTNMSQSFRCDNSKIIRLIRQKIYPLHASDVYVWQLQKATLIFPKLKEKISNHKEMQNTNPKKYIQIDLNKEQVNHQDQVQTDIQDQLINKYKINDLKKSNEVETSQFSFYTKIGKPKKLENNSKSQEEQQKQNVRFSSLHETNSSQKEPSSINDQNATAKMNLESLFHSQYLTKIKMQVEKQKRKYKKEINLTELQGIKEKQNYSIEYIVNLLSKKQEKEKLGTTTSFYDDYSPNNIPEFMKMLKKKKQRPLKLWEQFEQSQSLKDKINEEDLRSKHLIEYSIQKNIAVIEEQNEIEQENILSAKYRMKTNHKKLVEIHKNRSKV